MRVRDALDQLDAIHEHLTRAEVYRGFRAVGVALTGVVALVAALVQPLMPGAGTPAGFVHFWVVVAAVGATLGGGAALYAYAFREGEDARRRTRRVFAQFLPCVAAGGLITLGFVRGGPELIAYLPGAWACVFGLGLVSARPYLPRGVGLVGLGYILAGGVLVCRVPAELSGWAVGGVFGVGHLAAAAVLVGREGEANG